MHLYHPCPRPASASRHLFRHFHASCLQPAVPDPNRRTPPSQPTITPHSPKKLRPEFQIVRLRRISAAIPPPRATRCTIRCTLLGSRGSAEYLPFIPHSPEPACTGKGVHVSSQASCLVVPVLCSHVCIECQRPNKAASLS